MGKARNFAKLLNSQGKITITGLSDEVAQTISNSVPAGTVAFFSMNSAPTGYLKANGAAISRTTYAALFTAIGTTYGAGNGSTTFALPDLRGEFMRGLDDGRGVDSGRSIGTAQSDQFKNHYHRTSGGGGLNGNSINAGFAGAGSANSTYNDTTNPIGQGGTETRPRNVALLACIKF